jgi:hypothetical protein
MLPDHIASLSEVASSNCFVSPAVVAGCQKLQAADASQHGAASSGAEAQWPQCFRTCTVSFEADASIATL